MNRIKFFVAGFIAIIALSVLTSSCKKVECYCYTYDNVSASDLSYDLSAALKKLNRSSDCSDLEYELKRNFGYKTMTCNER